MLSLGRDPGIIVGKVESWVSQRLQVRQPGPPGLFLDSECRAARKKLFLPSIKGRSLSDHRGQQGAKLALLFVNVHCRTLAQRWFRCWLG